MKRLLIPLLVISLSIPALSMQDSQNYVLLTGFEPFNGYEVNPSEMVASELNGTMIGDVKILSLILPVDFNRSSEKVREAIEKYEPLAVICMGLDGSARKIEVERIAINLKSVYINSIFAGWKRIDENGPFLLFSTLPVNKIVESINENGTDARISCFAGTYSCNYVFYSTLLYMEEKGRETPAGFIHLPPLKSQKRYGMELKEMEEAIKIAVEKSIE